jgi:acetyl esterase/lipase
VRAAALLLRFSDENAKGFLPAFGKHQLDETMTTVPTAAGEMKARFYSPRGLEGAPALLLVHGVHRLGIDEPRFTRLARTIAATGITVFTPEFKEIVDYRIDPATIERIGESARALSSRAGKRGAGIMGISFGGGLALMAASDPRFASDVKFVVTIGAHHDMARVLRFFSTNQVERPDGGKEPLEAHHYGAMVLIYSHVERVVDGADVDIARQAIRLWLWEKFDEARARARDLSPASRAKIEALFEGKPEFKLLIADLARDQQGAALVSPHGHVRALRAPVFLLHGAGDTVIPSAEMLWLQQEIPPHLLRTALKSEALIHAEFGHEPSFVDQWALVRFFAGILDAAESA